MRDQKKIDPGPVKRWVRKGLIAVLVLFIASNIIALIHSYRFTHFGTSTRNSTADSQIMSGWHNIQTLITGINSTRPENQLSPPPETEVIQLKSNKLIECWNMRNSESKGTVILFHGYHGEKSSLLEQSSIFQNNGYSTMLVDFMGSGGSEGNQTTIGYYEAEQVKTCFDYVASTSADDIYLFGTSMGSVAIMKAIHDHEIRPKGIIIECPFGSMYQTVCARFRAMGAPSFPMAGLLVFWGGVQNGFWAFGHNPIDYASGINCPTLILYGQKDEKVSRSEIDAIFHNLNGPRKLIVYPEAGHENFLRKYKTEWAHDVLEFLTTD